MDSVQFQHIKMEKPRGILNFTARISFTNLIRLIELVLLVILISKLSFPSVKLSGDVFKEAATFLVSPRFVFFIGNAIVITLFAKSGRYGSVHDEPSKSTTEATSNDLYHEFVQKSEKKRSEVYETKTEQKKKPSGVKRVSFGKSQSFEAVKQLKRYESEKHLRRYESEKHMKICDSDKKVVVRVKKLEDRMNNEQFRTKIEAFIARQKRIQKDEEHLII